MAIHHQAQQERVDAGLGFDWDLLPASVDAAGKIPALATQAQLRRVGKSHRGISELVHVRQLWAYAVDQNFLDEICQMEQLELLHLDKVTATDLSSLRKLSKLTSLTVINASKVQDLAWVPQHAGLQAIAIGELKAIHDLTPLSTLTHLRALGVEGGVWTPMQVATLAPLAALSNLESLFITNLQVTDKSLQPLHALANLRVLQCAKFFARDAFVSLAAARPGLSCDWFDEASWRPE